MEYKRFGDKILLRIDPEEEVIEKLTELCKSENIRLGDIRGLGATDDYDVCVYDIKSKKYYAKSVDVQSEITSLYGTITEKDGEPYLHVHMQAMSKGGIAYGGHLKRCVISGTLEAVVTVLDGVAGRQLNPKTGLNDIAF